MAPLVPLWRRYGLFFAYTTRSPVWPDLAKFRHFVQNVKVFGIFLRVYSIFGIVMILLWLHFYGNKLILFAENGQTFETIKPFGHTPLLSNVYQIGTLTSKSFIDSLLKLIVVSNSWNLSSMEAVWPDWAIYWTLGNFLKPLGTINLSKSLRFFL